MTKYAVVDIGTNSARLMIAKIKDGKTETVQKTLRMIRVGEGMLERKCIVDAAMQRTKSALNEFTKLSEYSGVQKKNFYCFATSAVRDAGNKHAFVDYIKKECGVEIEIISGDTEATLGFAGSVQGRGGMFDIGGGSTEVMFGSLTDVAFSKSFQIGTVRSLQLFPAADDADMDAYIKAHELAANTFSDIPLAHDIGFVGIGGTATALAAIDLKLKEYCPQRVQDHQISFQRAITLCDMLKSKTKQQRKTLVGLEERRADVIVFGAIIMLEFMRAVGAKRIKVSDRDNQEGYLAQKLGI